MQTGSRIETLLSVPSLAFFIFARFEMIFDPSTDNLIPTCFSKPIPNATYFPFLGIVSYSGPCHTTLELYYIPPLNNT